MQYFNYKDEYGKVETIDEICIETFASYSEYKEERTRLLNEYNMCHGYSVYLSSRSNRSWREKG